MEYVEPIAKVLSLALGFYLIWKAAFRLRGILSGEDVHLERDGSFANNDICNRHNATVEGKVSTYRVDRGRLVCLSDGCTAPPSYHKKRIRVMTEDFAEKNYRIVYPKGDRSRLSVALVWPWEKDDYDIASSMCFTDRDVAQEHAQTLAAKYDLALDKDSKPSALLD